ncbi:hypothetical protein Nmel_001825 [Mimus melanotis]
MIDLALPLLAHWKTSRCISGGDEGCPVRAPPQHPGVLPLQPVLMMGLVPLVSLLICEANPHLQNGLFCSKHTGKDGSALLLLKLHLSLAEKVISLSTQELVIM